MKTDGSKLEEQQEQLDIPVVIGSCFMWHNWTKWKKHELQYEHNIEKGMEIYGRHCTKCFKIETKCCNYR